MAEEEEVIRALEDMGLEREEADVYRILLRKGIATVAEISASLRFSRTKIYNIFDRLVSKGWVKVVSKAPKMFAPVDPERILESKREAMFRAYETAIKALKPIYDQLSLKASEIVVLRGIEAFRKVEEMVRGAKKEVRIVASIVPRNALKRFAPLLLDVKRRGVRIFSIIPPDVLPPDLATKLRARIQDVPQAGMLIVDGKEVYVGGLDLSLEGGGDMVGIWTENQALVTFNTFLFDTLYGGGDDEI